MASMTATNSTTTSQSSRLKTGPGAAPAGAAASSALTPGSPIAANQLRSSAARTPPLSLAPAAAGEDSRTLENADAGWRREHGLRWIAQRQRERWRFDFKHIPILGHDAVGEGDG